jgi:capsular exopolysaccharide synthesis family protein
MWLVLIVALLVALPGAIWTAKRPSVYRVTAQVLIEAPQFDPILSSIVSQDVAGHERDAVEKYVPNQLALLRSRGLADRVVSDPGLVRSSSLDASGEDAAQELVTTLQTRQVPATGFFDVILEGTDPARITRLLNTLLSIFKEDALERSKESLDTSRRRASTNLQALKLELLAIDKEVEKIVRNSPIFAPGGKHLLQDRYTQTESVLMQKRIKHDDLVHQARIAEMFPNLQRAQAQPTVREARIAELVKQKKFYTQRAAQLRRTAKRFDSDPSAIHLTEMLADVMDELRELQAQAPPEPPNLAALAESSSTQEIEKLDEEARTLLKELQESMPKYQQYLTFLSQREQMVQRIHSMETKLSSFDVLREARKDPVTIVQSASEPTVPIRPNRALLIGMFVVLGLVLGIVMVAALEHVDHSVKVPEHLSVGLTLPLFGVIPRIRRTAYVHRGGHLWTPGAPGSLEADAYRNLRASLLGAAVPNGPIGTLLVTSAKPGEGKSTTALNLAATCARAGERTLLMDVDLRRPSLADVFDGGGHRLGLVDILRGDLPWQRAVIRSDIPNLDFLSTGDTFDVPIEVLGTLELRQLLITLSRHYDRVIVDGPAVLGMADCRMLGRIVDAALLVVRCGAHALQPLQRAKAMLEQSQVVIAGVVFNDLSEDLKNWSSYGGYGGYGDTPVREAGSTPGLPSPLDGSSSMAGANSYAV